MADVGGDGAGGVPEVRPKDRVVIFDTTLRDGEQSPGASMTEEQKNAFTHEAGIHQDGVIKERTTYEIMRPADVGWEHSRVVLGKHSGRHGLAFRLAQLGVTLDRDALDEAYRHFVHLADRQKEVNDAHLRDLVARVQPEAAALSYGV